VKKSPSKKLWEKITKNDPVISYLINPDKILKKYPDEKKAVDFVSSLVLNEEKNKPGKRKSFSISIQENTKIKQGFLCNNCKKPPKHWAFHHKDGNRSNNRPENCEGLCLDCHAKKTRNRRF